MVSFPHISLEEMDRVRLMNRVDTKYVIAAPMLDSILKDALDCGYRALFADGVQEFSYESLYYDTAGLEMFMAHRNGKLVRQKIRVRQYRDSGMTFLEIKRKNNRGRTKKKRMAIAKENFGDFRRDTVACSWLQEWSEYDPGLLSPSLSVSFTRVTLVNPEFSERVTIDRGLRFCNPRTSVNADAGSVVVIEIKQDSRSAGTMKGLLLRHRARLFKMSKYCIGICMTDSEVRKGRFLEKLRYINKINKINNTNNTNNNNKNNDNHCFTISTEYAGNQSNCLRSR